MTTTQINGVTPDCRYGHGNLFKVNFSQHESRFAMVAVGHMNGGFSGCLYVCKTCGYTEFFDDMPNKTYEENGPSAGGDA